MAKLLSALTKKRLLRLADRLNKVKRSHFDLSRWYAIDSSTAAKRLADNGGFAKTDTLGKITEINTCFDPDSGTYVAKTKRTPRAVILDEGFCGSVACVLGHAALIPEFNRAGLYVDVTNVQERLAEEFALFDVGLEGKIVGSEGIVVYRDPKKPRSKVRERFEAGQAFFGIPENHATMMFGGYHTNDFYGLKDTDFDAVITPKRAAKYIRKYVETDGQYAEDVIAKVRASGKCSFY